VPRVVAIFGIMRMVLKVLLRGRLNEGGWMPVQIAGRETLVIVAKMLKEALADLRQ